MLDTVNIALGQMEVIPGRPDINTGMMLDMITEAKGLGADLVVFPEMAVPGSMLGDDWEYCSFLKDCEEYGSSIINASDDITVLFGNVAIDWNKTGEDGRVRKYNAVFAARNGKLLGGESFLYPFRIKTGETDGHFFSLEKLAWENGKSAREMALPIMLDIAGERLNIGFADALTDMPLDLIVNMSSSTYIFEQDDREVYKNLAKNKNIPLIYINNVGAQNKGKTVYVFDGRSAIYSKNGSIVACCPAFEPSLKIVPLNLKADMPVLKPVSMQEMEALYKAVVYGIKGFLNTIKMDKVVIGASGGIDSALSAALYSLVLGSDNVLLINMPGAYTSATTSNLAAQLARNLDCPYGVVPIQDSVKYTTDQIGDSTITRHTDNNCINLKISSIIQENIQARDRSARILAAIASAFGGGFTCNANKSEVTVGYSTFYGDQAGFFAALADLWKHQVYALARYINDHIFQRSVIPEGSFQIVPSAELSPEQAVDQGKGDPLIYPYHDYLLRAFVERWDRADPEDVLDWYIQGRLEDEIGCESGLVKKIFKNSKEFIVDLERWWEAYTGLSVAKRIQSPPVLSVSKRAFGADLSQAQKPLYYTLRYKKLKREILREE